MNKITPEKEAKLTKQFITEIKPDTYDRLEKIVAAVFSKAIEEQHFAKIYAKVRNILPITPNFPLSFAKTATKTGTRMTRLPSTERKMEHTRQSLAAKPVIARSSQRVSERSF